MVDGTYNDAGYQRNSKAVPSLTALTVMRLTAGSGPSAP